MVNNCDNICFKKGTKMIIEKAECVDSCELDSKYRYELNNFCYEQCPEGFLCSNFKCYSINDDDCYIDNIFQDIVYMHQRECK